MNISGELLQFDETKLILMINPTLTFSPWKIAACLADLEEFLSRLEKNSDYAAQLYPNLQFSSSSTKFKWSLREKWVTATAAAEKIKHEPEKQFPRTLFSFYKQVRVSAADFNAHHFLASISRPSSCRVLASPPMESTRSSGFMRTWHLTLWKETLTWLNEQLELLRFQGWNYNGADRERFHMDQFNQSELDWANQIGLKPKGRG